MNVTSADELAAVVADFRESLETNLGITGLPDLPRCALEAFGWRQPVVQGGETKHTPELEIIILGHLDTFRYFDKPFAAGRIAAGPTCYSNDLQTGKGAPGCGCQTCSLRAFGEQGQAPACRAYRLLYGIRAEDRMLLEVSLAPTSIKASTDHFRCMRALHVPIYRQVSLLGYETSRGYPRATFAHGPMLDASQANLTRAFSATMRSLLDRIKVGSAQHAETDAPF